MKSAVIMLGGLPMIDTPTSIETVKYNDEKKLVAHLKSLQMGYCESDRPKIRKFVLKGKRVIDCYSEVDFHHYARVGYSLKESAGKPVKILE